VVSAVATSDDNALAIVTAQGFTGRMTGAGYDTTTGGDHSVGLADKAQATAGTTTMLTWRQSVNATDRWAGITFALRPVPANTPPTVSLTSPATGAVFVSPANITLTATSADTDGTITKVEFFHGGTNLIATVTAAPYTFNWANVAAAGYTLTAKATDNLGAVTTSAPVTVTVNAPNAAPTVSITSPANGATFTAPADITIAADAQDNGGGIALVEFFQGTTLIATRTAAPYSILWTGVTAGGYSLTARATDNLGAITTSAPVNVMVNAGVAQMFFIHTDHLNTPRVITNQTSQVVWRWDHAEPFGNNPPNENPSGLGTFTCNLRLPGQYFDKETNTHYNYFRDYDPAIGRYVQSDPIGLEGGINTYLYVLDPLTQIDPAGLMGYGGGANSPGPRVFFPPQGPTCEGTWEPLSSALLPGSWANLPFCKCTWVCRSCTGAYTGKLTSNFGVPAGQKWNDPQATTERRRGRPPQQKPMPGDPTACACERPTGEKPCECK